MIYAKVLPWILGVMLLSGLGFYYGDKKATERYLPQITNLKAIITFNDEQAKATKKQQEENTNAIANEINDSVSNIHEYYTNRVLPRNDKVSPCTSTYSPKEVSPGTSEQSTIGQSFEERCVNDALIVRECKNFFLINRFPIGQ